MFLDIYIIVIKSVQSCCNTDLLFHIGIKCVSGLGAVVESYRCRSDWRSRSIRQPSMQIITVARE